VAVHHPDHSFMYPTLSTKTRRLGFEPGDRALVRASFPEELECWLQRRFCSQGPALDSWRKSEPCFDQRRADSQVVHLEECWIETLGPRRSRFCRASLADRGELKVNGQDLHSSTTELLFEKEAPVEKPQLQTHARSFCVHVSAVSTFQSQAGSSASMGLTVLDHFLIDNQAIKTWTGLIEVMQDNPLIGESVSPLYIIQSGLHNHQRRCC